MKRWWDGLKISHKIVWAFLGLIAFPFSLLLLWNFGSFAVQYEQQLSQSGQYMLGMVVQDVNEKLDHVEMLVHALSSNRRLISFLSHRSLKWKKFSGTGFRGRPNCTPRSFAAAIPSI